MTRIKYSKEKKMKKVLSIVLAIITIYSSLACGLSAYAEEEITAPDTVYEVRAEQISQTSIKLYWRMPSWADVKSEGFEIYQYNPGEKSYTPIADVKASSNKCDYTYDIYNLNTATKYIFSVRGYIERNGVRYYSPYSEEGYACTSPSETKIKSVKYVSKGKIKLSWSSVSNATGYIIEYSTNKKFKNDGTTCYVMLPKKTTSKTITGLAKKTYYFRIRTYIEYNKKYFCSDYSDVKSKAVKTGASLKEMINSIKTTTDGKKYIKNFTENGVDISKYKTTYDRLKAIYDWHSKNNTNYGWNCVGCNSNFSACVAMLFMNSGKDYDSFIIMEAGKVKNGNGSKVIHKWTVIYLSGVPYIFDPRLQGYTSNKKGTTYFGALKGSSVGKKYLYENYFGGYPTTFDSNKDCTRYIPHFYEPFVDAVKKPSAVSASVSAGKGQINVKWKKISSANGYEIQYSTKKDFSSSQTILIDNNTTTSNTISNLSKKQIYYVRVRAYKMIGDSKMDGFWSSQIKIKTK